LLVAAGVPASPYIDAFGYDYDIPAAQIIQPVGGVKTGAAGTDDCRVRKNSRDFTG